MNAGASAIALTHPAEPSRVERLVRHGTYVLSMWLCARILIEGLGVVVVGLFGVPAYSRPGWFGLFFNWDSGYFDCVATHGYFGPPCAGGQTSQRLAFFPAYPLTARGVAWILGAGTVDAHGIVVAMWLVAALASLGSAALLYAMVLHQHGPASARYATALLLLGPYALFLVASYSESLFLLFALAAWLCCLRRRYVWCALFGAGASLTRITGCFLVVGLVVLYLCQTLSRSSRHPFRWREVITVALSGAGAGIYVGWVWWRTGRPLAWLTAQSTGWNRHTEWPWVTLYHQGIHVVFETRRDWQVQAVLELVFAGLVVLAMAWFVRSRAWPELTFVGLTAVAMMTSTTYLSLARNTLTLFPLTVLAAGLLVRQRRRYAVAVFSGAVMLLCYNGVQFALGNWAD